MDAREYCKSCTLPEVYVSGRLLTYNNVGGQGGYTCLANGHSWKISDFPLYESSDDESSYELSDEDSNVEGSEYKFNKREILFRKNIHSAECAVYSAQQCEYMLQYDWMAEMIRVKI